jgi:hypothetical protein
MHRAAYVGQKSPSKDEARRIGEDSSLEQLIRLGAIGALLAASKSLISFDSCS